jgi:hypothetical protein
MRREECWLGQIAERGLANPEATAGLGDLVSELRAAFALRRRLEAQLASERELQELIGGGIAENDWDEPSLEDVEQRKAG